MKLLVVVDGCGSLLAAVIVVRVMVVMVVAVALLSRKNGSIQQEQLFHMQQCRLMAGEAAAACLCVCGIG